MAQQINLCNPIFLTPKRYFSAATMLQALTVFAVLGGIIAAYWVWSLDESTRGLKKAINANQAEVGRLQTAITVNKAQSGPADAALVQDLKTQRDELERREKLLEEAQWGLFREGWGHSARLQLVAQTIPAQVWLTEVKADNDRLEFLGSTLEPAALNEWMARLSASPLLQGQKVSTFKVERMVDPLQSVGAGAGAGAAPAVSPAVWAFSMINTLAAPRAVVAPGAKP